MHFLWSQALVHIAISYYMQTSFYRNFFYVSTPYGKGSRQNAAVHVTSTWQIYVVLGFALLHFEYVPYLAAPSNPKHLLLKFSIGAGMGGRGEGGERTVP